MRSLAVIALVLTTFGTSGCGYNKLQSADEQIAAAWAEVLNQYQRRADLIPNLVETVKGFAAQEQEVLVGVTEARSKVSAIQATPELINDPEAFARFQAAQGELSSALSRLLVTVERYPELKSDANFRDLQAQLEGTENRITVERQRYNEKAQAYNTARLRFPAVIFSKLLGFGEKAYFTAAPGADQAPTVDFQFGDAPATPAEAPQ